jgi:uncharacterized membrane protein YgcG
MALTGALVTAMCAMSQSYTTSAKPGAINYIEGNATLDGQPLVLNYQQYGPQYLNANQTLSTTNGKAEVLLTPGVFLRLGDNSAVRMVSPSLTNTQVALERGEAMLEVDQLIKGNNISVLDGTATITVQQTGLYRFMAGPQPTAAVYDGKLLVREGDRQIDLKKGHQTALAGVLKSQQFDRKQQEDALYAWSNVRSEYNSEASYQAARTIYVNNYYGGGPWGFWGPDWYWDAGFGWAWLPYDGAFFSPFGWGFFGPAYIPYVARGYGWHGHPYAFRGTPNTHIAAAGRASAFAGGGFHGGGFAGGGFHGGGGGGGGHR